MAAALAPSRLSHNDAFAAVFPTATFATPTPEATPNIGSIPSPVQSFRGFASQTSDSFADGAVILSRAWSLVTRYLTINPGVEGGPPSAVDGALSNAFLTILASESTCKELVSWYTNEMNVHFRYFVRPLLNAWDAPVKTADAAALLERTIQVLDAAQRHRYLDSVGALVASVSGSALQQRATTLYLRVQTSLHTLVVNSLPRQRLQRTLASVMYQQLTSSLADGSNPEKCIEDGEKCHCRVTLQARPLQALRSVGLGGLLGERAFAHAVHRFLQGPAIETRCFAVDWTTGWRSVVPKLKAWVEEMLSPVIEHALSALTGNAESKLAPNDIQQFVSMAVSNLGRLRCLSLFEYVKRYTSTGISSHAPFNDIHDWLADGGLAAKAHVCQSLSEQVQTRLLHAGASTPEILGIYISVIHAFKHIDQRGVLLEKVALPIRKYLRGREDTAGIIAASFLADSNAAPTSRPDNICPDITYEAEHCVIWDNNHQHKKSLNWDDGAWEPEPIDAGPDYKSPAKHDDIIAYILGLFEQEEFIKEVTTVLAQHLLHGTDLEYAKETRLIELFKSRLDASKLQAAEVMLKDVRDSASLGRRINPPRPKRHVPVQKEGTVPTPREIQTAIPEEGITLPALYSLFDKRIPRPQFLAAVKLVATKRDDLFFAKRTRLPPAPPAAASPEDGEDSRGVADCKAQILSSFFWPALRANEFTLPPPLLRFQREFEDKFDALGSQRKLHFRPALSRASVRLELEDRVVEESDVAGWRASVIDAFSQPGAADTLASQMTLDNDGDTIAWTVEQLAAGLEMEEELVQDALSFWTSKNVLYRRETGVYAVLERLDMAIDAAPLPVGQPHDTISAVVSQDAMLREYAAMFETFIANMLRNQGAKAIGGPMGITNLLKMVMPAFTYGDDEVEWLLQQMEARGEVVRNGDVWAVS